MVEEYLVLAIEVSHTLGIFQTWERPGDSACIFLLENMYVPQVTLVHTTI